MDNNKWLLLSAFAVASGVLILMGIRRPTLAQQVFSQDSPNIFKLTTTSVVINDKGIPFIVSQLDKNIQKPQASNRKPFIPPFEQGLHIADLGEYRLLFNKYCVTDKHVIITTKEEIPQETPLTIQDCEIILQVIREVDGFAFYNKGPNSGYSQPHKHFQVIPYRTLQKFPISEVIPDRKTGVFTIDQFQFQHKFCSLPDGVDGKGVLYRIHDILDEFIPESYNLIITARWILIVPRSKELAFNCISLNSVAYIGLILVKSDDSLRILNEVGPLAAITDAAVPLIQQSIQL